MRPSALANVLSSVTPEPLCIEITALSWNDSEKEEENGGIEDDFRRISSQWETFLRDTQLVVDFDVTSSGEDDESDDDGRNLRMDKICLDESALKRIDEEGIPDPITRAQTQEILQRLEQVQNDVLYACSVCDEICELRRCDIVLAKNLPAKFFEILQVPKFDGRSDFEPLESELINQYSVVDFFPGDDRFKNVLLSPRGVLLHSIDCSLKRDCDCRAALVFCWASGCYASLMKRQTLPKFSIANGNWVGRLPPNLRDMTFGSRSLLRPVHSCGTVVCYTHKKNLNGGYKLSGHMYSVHLDTVFARSKLPLDPSECPIRVVVLSPYTSDEASIRCSKVAQTKKRYIYEPDKIEAACNFFSRIKNKIMISAVELDLAAIRNLPDGDASPDVVTYELITEDSIEKAESNTLGGPSLVRSAKEMEEAVPMQAYVSLPHESCTNSYNAVCERLSGVSSEDGVSSCPVSSDKFTNFENIVLSSERHGFQRNSEVYVVRPKPQFANDTDKNWLELRYPDKFPFGRGGFGEKGRLKAISRKLLAQHFLKLSTREFFSPDFVLPLYDMLVRQDVATGIFVRSKVPSSVYDSEGNVLSRGAAYGRLPEEELLKAGEYKRKCAIAASKGIPVPPPPSSTTGLGASFFRDMESASAPVMHSIAAGQRNRQDSYAAHYSNGKATIWLTFSPDDTKSLNVFRFADDKWQRQQSFELPTISERFEMLAEHPVAAALNFKKVVDDVLEVIVGWNVKEKKPFAAGGLFGIPKAWVYSIEEQGRLTLHCHMLIWVAGHSDLEEQLTGECGECVKQTANEPDAEMFCEHVNLERLKVKIRRLTEFIERTIQSELELPNKEMEIADKCRDCGGKLRAKNIDVLKRMRRIPKDKEHEPCPLECCDCSNKFAIVDQLLYVIDKGFKRCFKRDILNDDELLKLMLYGMKPWSCENDSIELSDDKRKLLTGLVQIQVQLHDWRHRKSCFKQDCYECRYGFPKDPVSRTVLSLVMIGIKKSSTAMKEDNRDNFVKNRELQIDVKKRDPFIMMADCSAPLLTALGCNNYISYVENQKISMYCGAYATKYCNESDRMIADVVGKLTTYMRKVRTSQDIAVQNADHLVGTTSKSARSDYSLGIGRLFVGTRASTHSTSKIGTPMAAYCTLGGATYASSHATVCIPIAQATDFLQGKDIGATIHQNGLVSAAIYNYVYRSKDLTIDSLNYWEFSSNFEKHVKARSSNSKENPSRMGNQTRAVYEFLEGHPECSIYGHRKRSMTVWPRYSGRRLPNVEDLEYDDAARKQSEVDEDRERFAIGILIMFYPFRQLSDVYDEGTTWWSSFCSRKISILRNENSRKIMRNMQNWYESFCTKGDSDSIDEEENEEMEALDDGEMPCGALEEVEDVIVHEENDSTFLTNSSNLLVSENCESRKDLFSLNIGTIANTRIDFQSAKESVEELLSRRKASAEYILPGRALALNDDGTSSPSLVETLFSEDCNIKTRVDLLRNIIEALSRRSRNPTEMVVNNSIPNNNYPSISDHSAAWGLNDEQHAGFELGAAALLHFVMKTCSHNGGVFNGTIDALQVMAKEKLREILPEGEHLRLLLTGPGGTGKSKVIHALLSFSRRWLSSANMVVCASSGAAATLVGGVTLHAALGIGIGKHDRDPTARQMNIWSEIALLVLDEVSMIKPDLLARMDARLRKLKNNPHQLFGGVHVMFVGDFFQIEPVGGPSLYCDLKLRDSKKLDELTITGLNLWSSCLTDVVELKENYRQREDPEWTDSLARWRMNNPTPGDIELVNSRFIDPNGDSSSVDSIPCHAVIAVEDNRSREDALRTCENNVLAKQQPILPNCTNWRERGLLMVKAGVRKGATGTAPLSELEQERVRSVPASKLGAQGNLLCMVGACYMVGQNADVVKGIANGTVCYLMDVILENEEEVGSVVTKEGYFVHVVSVTNVKCLVFKHSSTAWHEQLLFKSLPRGCFPVLPLSKVSYHQFGGSGTRMQVKVTQFPIVLSKILTGHKLQGQTLSHVVLGNLRKHKNGSSGWLYVILSRVTSIHGFFSLVRVPQNVAFYKPRTDVLKEMKRLEEIQTQTLKRLQHAKQE